MRSAADGGSDRSLIGRRTEISVVSDVLAGLAAGRGESLLVVGEAGIGKSALLEMAAHEAEAAGLRVLRGACDELGGGFPLTAIAELLGAESGSSGAVDGKGSERGLLSLVGDPVQARAEHLLIVVDGLCSRAPLLLVLDDLQWADEASLLLWRRLGRIAGQSPLVVLGAARPVPTRVELEAVRRDLRIRGGRELALGPLTAAQAGTLVERWAGGSPGARLTAALEAAAGNPLYVCESIDAWSRAGRLALERGVLELDDRVAPDASETKSLTVAITDRLDFLSPRCRETLRTAALLGTEFSPTELGGVAGLDIAELVRVLQEAIAARVLESNEGRLRFRHGLIKQALYESTPTALRALLAQHAMQWLIETNAGIERVAGLLHLAGDTVDGRALDWLTEHIGELVGLAPTLAFDLIDQALASLPTGDSRFAVLQDHLAIVALHLGKFEVSERTAHSVLATSRDPDRRGQALWNLGTTLSGRGRAEEGLALVSEACGRYPSDSLWHARLTALRAYQLFVLHRLDEADTEAARALAEGESLPDATATGFALYVVSGVHALRGQNAESLRWIDHGVAVAATDPRLTDLKLLMLCNRVGQLLSLDRRTESAAELRRVRAMAEQVGTRRMATIQLLAADQAFNLGRWDEVTAEADALFDSGFLETNRQMAADILGMAALVAVHRDDPDTCHRILGLLGTEHSTGAEHEVQSAFVSLARALAAEHAGRPEEGIAILSVAFDHKRIGSNSNVEVLPTLSRLARRLGQDDVVRRAADLAAQRDGGPSFKALARWCRALADDDPAELIEVAGYYRSQGQLCDMANALEDAAVIAARTNRHEAARDAITEAMTAYAELGALWDAQRAKSQLRAEGLQIGVRGPRKRPTTGLAALTPTERRVAELVAQGGSNTEIAERLVISRRTVEVHVSHILAKLQVGSRGEIAPAMAG